MNREAISEYREYLEGCRFCPMCKPAAEVANLTQYESHSTRARAMLLWRYLEGMMELSDRDIEILYQSTLDTISEAWCVHHYKVSDYLLTARREIIKAHREPEWITRTLKAYAETEEAAGGGKGSTVFLAGEVAEFLCYMKMANKWPEDYPSFDNEAAREGVERYVKTAEKLLTIAGIDGTILTMQTGALPYVLGETGLAKKNLENIRSLFSAGKVEKIIADGPQTLWVLKNLLPELPDFEAADIEIISLSELILSADFENGKKRGGENREVFFHDTRYPFYLGETVADDRILSPDFTEPEEAAGSGSVYENPRNLLDNLGFSRSFSVWTRSLCRSCGSDDGLYISCPDYAEGLALQCLQHAEETGASEIVTGSVLAALYLSTLSQENKSSGVIWLPELLVE